MPKVKSAKVAGPSQKPNGAAQSRNCDHCHTRKCGCDQKSPCSCCSNIGIEYTYKRPRPLSKRKTKPTLSKEMHPDTLNQLRTLARSHWSAEQKKRRGSTESYLGGLVMSAWKASSADEPTLSSVREEDVRYVVQEVLESHESYFQRMQDVGRRSQTLDDTTASLQPSGAASTTPTSVGQQDIDATSSVQAPGAHQLSTGSQQANVRSYMYLNQGKTVTNVPSGQLDTPSNGFNNGGTPLFSVDWSTTFPQPETSQPLPMAQDYGWVLDFLLGIQSDQSTADVGLATDSASGSSSRSISTFTSPATVLTECSSPAFGQSGSDCSHLLASISSQEALIPQGGPQLGLGLSILNQQEGHSLPHPELGLDPGNVGGNSSYYGTGALFGDPTNQLQESGWVLAHVSELKEEHRDGVVARDRARSRDFANT